MSAKQNAAPKDFAEACSIKNSAKINRLYAKTEFEHHALSQ